MFDGISFSELLAYSDEETRRWKQFFERHSEAIDMPLDIAGDVRQLVMHIFAVELFFANTISGSAIDPDALPTATLDEIFAIHEKASAIYRDFLAAVKPEQWQELVVVDAVGLKASRRKMVAQAFTHSMRHWAQISTFLRQRGLKQEWNHDWLMSKVVE